MVSLPRAKTVGRGRPTDRMERAARLIAAGKPVAAAMAEAGYGPGCIDGLAPMFPGMLESAGLLKPTKAKATTGKPDTSPVAAKAAPGEE